MTSCNSFDGGSTEGVMMRYRAFAAGPAVVFALFGCGGAAFAQSSPERLPDLVVTADRTPSRSAIPAVRSASSTDATIATTNPGSLVDALRTVPGLDITETGGPGSTTIVRLRGANTGQTLVMIDGIRINDPTAASGDFDFSMLAPSTIDHIEVLKGPQSALYGSDAIGGVINIITTKGTGPAQFNVRTEGGSYGTVVTTGSVIGSQGPWSYAATGSGQHSNGFSRFGYRIPAIEAQIRPRSRSDGFDRIGGSARIGYDAGEGVRLEAGTLVVVHALGLRSVDRRRFPTRLQAPAGCCIRSGDALGRYVRRQADPQPQRVRDPADRSFNDVTYKTNMLPQNTTSIVSDFIGNSTGAEYQGNLKLGPLGSLVVRLQNPARDRRHLSDQLAADPRPANVPQIADSAGHQFAVRVVAAADRRAAERHPRRPGRRCGERRALRNLARDCGLYDCRDRHQIPRQRRHRRQGADLVSAL